MTEAGLGGGLFLSVMVWQGSDIRLVSVLVVVEAGMLERLPDNHVCWMAVCCSDMFWV